ncbi:MAG TPA: hypothetical protein VEV43_12310 [Actinomycetota bacterium]|nr:hypothetical protein [Actinomycetota bacterium]
MRTKALVSTAVLLVLSTAVPGEAARPRRDMARYHYSDNNHHFGGPQVGFGTWDPADSYAFDLRKGERSVSVMVLDDRERPVAATVVQIQWDGDYGSARVGHAVTHEEFCGRTAAPVPVVPDLPVEIFLQKGVCDDGTPSLPTEGDIVVDFHRG